MQCDKTHQRARVSRMSSNIQQDKKRKTFARTNQHTQHNQPNERNRTEIKQDDDQKTSCCNTYDCFMARHEKLDRPASRLDLAVKL